MDVDELIARFMADEPKVHSVGYGQPGESEPAPAGTFRTDESCYRLIAATIGTGSVTMETGSGLSTLVFAARGCTHTAFFLDPTEEDRLRRWAGTHDLDLSGVTFVAGPSDEGLRTSDRPVDLFFLDGGHGYPLPQIDWFYGAGRVRQGGIVVIDDLQLWGPEQLDAFVDLDPRWELIERTPKWSAYRRLGDGPVAEDYDMQPFLPRRALPGPPRRTLNWKGRVVNALPEAVRTPVQRVARGRR